MIACLLICAVGVTCGACGNSTKKRRIFTDTRRGFLPVFGYEAGYEVHHSG